ncbi:hypothetical protein TspCOW1_02150 [Thiohalobacter sp. COW1]|uniref:DUF6441 family protein n=1 Tax=Thiohalobacter sp. COW1 TaxID=2795687 RepID=UPI001916312B|nr:DUF6441 family protein [Thiohalobacter sp. COW1]BCO30112.1 hypothetical protein TspCOW1_02150 [Thiohalobacter sp. COW1]
MKISLTTEGLLDRRRFNAWRNQTRQEMREGAVRAMRSVGREMVDDVRRDMRAGFKVRKAAFLRSMRVKVYDRQRTRFPALYIGSKIPWLGIHEQGGVIGRRMLIPLLPQHQRIGRKAFRRVIDNLMRSGNAFFIERNGKTILMAENIRENDRALARFKRGERLRSGQKRLRRGQEIPVAVLVDRVRLRRRFDIESTVRRKLPRLARAIQREFNR